MKTSRSIFISPEVWLVGLIGSAVVALGALWVASDPAWRLLDLREWSFTSEPEAAPGFFEKLQPPHPGRRVFELRVQLPRIPQEGDFAAAEVWVDIPEQDDLDLFCFRGFVQNDYHRPESQVAVRALEARLSANGKTAAPISLAAQKVPVEVAIDDIRPRNGQIHLRFEVRSTKTQKQQSWQTISLTSLDFAELQPCEDD